MRFDRAFTAAGGVVPVFESGDVARGAFARSLSHRSPRVVAAGAPVEAVVTVTDDGLIVTAPGLEFDQVLVAGRVVDRRAGRVAEVAIELLELLSTGPSLAALAEAQEARRASVTPSG